MKKLAYILAAVLALAACAKEKIHHPSEAEAPQTASAYEPVIVVDQEINQVTFSIAEKGVIPVWLFQDKSGEFTVRHAQNGYKQIFAAAGDYKVRLQVMNAAGVTPDYVENIFHIDNTIMDFDRYETMLAGKEWRIEGETDGHFGCGPSGTEGTEWWKAAAGDKESVGMYENRMTFSAGEYTFDPGTAGTLYVNTGYTDAPWGEYNTEDGNDFTVAVDAKTSSYTFTVEGADLFLDLEAGAYWPYIPNPEFTAAPRFKVVSSTAKQWVLINDNGGIAWTFTITSSKGETKFNGFNYTAESNLWKPVDPEDAHTYSFYYAPGWSQLPDPELEINGNAYSLSFPSATSDQWQNQFFIIPDDDKAVSLQADKQYDFSCIVYANKEIPNVTFKLTDATDDGNFLFAERETIPAGEEYIFWRSGLAGIDAAAVKMVFDFGGNADGTDVTISRITLKDHAIDDGTVLPSDEPGENPDGDNLLGGLYLQETWFSPADWSGGLDPQASYEGGTLTLTVPDGVGGGEWQGQVKLTAQVPADPEVEYEFSCEIESSSDGTCTVKVADANDDSNHAFFYDNGVSLAAYDTVSYLKEPVKPDQAYEAVMVIFDFGRLPAGTEITVTGIKLRAAK